MVAFPDRKHFRDTEGLEVYWRNFLGRGTRFPRSFGNLQIDTVVKKDDGGIGILLLLIQPSGQPQPTHGLIGWVEEVPNGSGRPYATPRQQRLPLDEISPA